MTCHCGGAMCWECGYCVLCHGHDNECKIRLIAIQEEEE